MARPRGHQRTTVPSLYLLRTLAVIVLVVCVASATGQVASLSAKQSFVGFDRNEYPGDEHLMALRRIFSFSGYWLNVPPGTNGNTWAGKRTRLREAGFGFLVLFDGRVDAELKKVPDARDVGRLDAKAAAEAARREGFPRTLSSFLIRKRAAVCCRNKRPTSMRGLTGSLPPDFAPESIARELRLRIARRA